MTELVVGKYEFYPYERDRCETHTVEELLEMLEKTKGRRGEDVRRPCARNRRSRKSVNDRLV